MPLGQLVLFNKYLIMLKANSIDDDKLKLIQIHNQTRLQSQTEINTIFTESK